MRKRPSLWLLSWVPAVLALLHCSLAFDDQLGANDFDASRPGAEGGPTDPDDSGGDSGPAPRGLLATQVVTGDRHSCAVNAAGVVYCWGDNDFGQLGLSLDVAAVSVPRRIELPVGVRALRLAAGANHTCALTDRKNLVCWGRNDVGQVARAPSATAVPDSVVLPSALTTASFVAVSAGRAHTCAVYVQPQVGDAGDVDAGPAGEVLRIACWGDNGKNQLARDDVSFAELPADVRRGTGGTSGPSVMARLAALGADFSVASLRVGDVYRVQGWGDTQTGAITTDPDAGPRIAPFSVVRAAGGPIDDALQLQAGAGHACAVVQAPLESQDPDASGPDPELDAGDDLDADVADAEPGDADPDAGARTVKKLLCWGGNESGQLARDVVSESELAAPSLGDPSFDGEVVLGGRTTCLIDAASLRCAGANDQGQLGSGLADDDPHPSFEPVRGLDGPVHGASLGARHGCALVEVAPERHQVACWGDNRQGQLGDAISLGAGYPDAGGAERFRRARAAFVVPAE